MWKVFSPFGVRFGPSSLWEGNRNAFGEERNTWAKGKSQWLDPPLPQNQKEKRRNDRSVTIITRPWENVAQTSSPPTGDWVKRKKKKKAPDIDPNHQHPVLGVSLGPHNHAGSYLKLPHFLVKSPPCATLLSIVTTILSGSDSTQTQLLYAVDLPVNVFRSAYAFCLYMVKSPQRDGYRLHYCGFPWNLRIQMSRNVSLFFPQGTSSPVFPVARFKFLPLKKNWKRLTERRFFFCPAGLMEEPFKIDNKLLLLLLCCPFV